MPYKIKPYSAITYDKFEEKYLILCMYSYLNHPQYNNFVQYLNSSNKIAVIFCKSDDEMFNIINSDLILKYKVYDLKGRDEILKELRADFDAMQVDYSVDDYDENGLISYLSGDVEMKIGDKVLHEGVLYTVVGFPYKHITSERFVKFKDKVQIISKLGFLSTVDRNLLIKEN